MSGIGRLAIDLGAGSGRAVVGSTGPDGFHLADVHRFHYAPRRVDGRLRWDAQALLAGLRQSVGAGAAYAEAYGLTLDSIGVDAWGVDYALLDARHRLLEDPVCYRDDRTSGIPDRVFTVLPREEIYARTGIQFLAFNTLYQLVAHCRFGLPPGTGHLLLMPDFCHHVLCDATVTERTNASTTQLLNASSGEWDGEIFERLRLPIGIMPRIVEAGTEVGRLRADWLPASHGTDVPRIVCPATHDTASAVAGTPLEDGWAFLSSGTWSLLGVERAAPELGRHALAANFTNEAGACGTTRLLKNVMGLWILDCCREAWRKEGYEEPLPALLARVAAIDGFAGFIDPDGSRFFAPASMPREIRASLGETGQVSHDDPALLTKVVLDSLAARYAAVIGDLGRITGVPVRGVHVVGGGSLNGYLNQVTADASGLPVVAGPVEATAIGNLAVQALGRGDLTSLADARARVRQSVRLERFEPRLTAQWREGRRRFQDVIRGE